MHHHKVMFSMLSIDLMCFQKTIHVYISKAKHDSLISIKLQKTVYFNELIQHAVDGQTLN